jgi:hypothetical protein
MAPEFFPLFAVAGLLAAIIVVLLLAVFVKWPQRFLIWLFPLISNRLFPAIVKYLRAILLIALIPLVCFLVLVVFLTYHQYFLNEPMAGAAGEGNLARVETLLDRGADADSWGIDFVEPALISAIKGGHRDVAELLLKHGADPSIKDSDGKSALQHARDGRHQDIVDVLVKAGAKE